MQGTENFKILYVKFLTSYYMSHDHQRVQNTANTKRGEKSLICLYFCYFNLMMVKRMTEAYCRT